MGIHSQGMHFSPLELLLRAANRLAARDCGAGKMQLNHDTTLAAGRGVAGSQRATASESPRRSEADHCSTNKLHASGKN